jgi:phosphatidylserine/phosphatidylglycerophosphate/cardiolipin synthase-like enzyme
MEGEAVRGLVQFYARTWERGLAAGADASRGGSSAGDLDNNNNSSSSSSGATALICSPVDVVVKPSPSITTTILLPSSHHRNPNFRFFHSPPPSTPLNVALLQLFERAKRDVYVQTPNLTSQPALSAILSALGRGVDVHIVTSRNMMLLEQLVTAGMTTAWCVRSLVRRYRALRFRASSIGRRLRYRSTDGIVDTDLEALHSQPGRLRIAYFRSQRPGVSEEEPVHSHLKLIIVDGQFTLLGSGNMDRASWYTSQELGILFQEHEFADMVKGAVDQVLKDRLDFVFNADTES